MTDESITHLEAQQRLYEMGISVNQTREILSKVHELDAGNWLSVCSQYRIRISYTDNTRLVISK